MSVNTPQGDIKRDAKAQAAAEKAYRKASRPWFKKKRFILPLILVAIILISSLANGGKGSNEGTDSPAAAPAAGNSPAAATSAPTKAAVAAFPGAKDNDVIGNAGAALKIGEATVTATPLVDGEATLNPTLCTAVKLVNDSKDTIAFNIFDWKIQTPSGTIVNTGFTGSSSMLSSGEIAPGGSASGDVCFDNKKAEKGTFVVLYEPVFKFFSDRAAWINKL
jgi:hypothetical protein